MVNTRFTHCLFNLLGITRTDRFNLRKTNAANEGLVGRLLYGRLVLGGGGQTYCHTHSNSLSNKMDNSLLDVRGINHKYIVVVGGVFYGIGRHYHVCHCRLIGKKKW